MNRKVLFWTEYPFAKSFWHDPVPARIFGDSGVEPITIRDLPSGRPGVVVVGGACVCVRWVLRVVAAGELDSQPFTRTRFSYGFLRNPPLIHMFMFCAGESQLTTPQTGHNL
jgi:hypothetical protein